MDHIINFIKTEHADYKMLLRNIPTVTVIFFVMSVCLMNLFASKQFVNYDYLALDCGFLLSWISFLSMDMLTKRFGAKASIKISILSIGVNFIMCGLFWIVSIVPNDWSAYYTFNSDIANKAIDATIGGTWYVVLGSMISFAVSSIVNCVINEIIGKHLTSNSFKVYALRSYVSTALGQFVDNMIFALLVSHNFFGWTMTQCVMCSIVGAVFELLAEVIFSPWGYRVSKKWEEEGVGQDYIDYISR